MRHTLTLLSVFTLTCSLFAQDVVIMPDSTNNRLVHFSPVDGSVINPNVFPLASGTTVHAMPVGNEIWVSEQIGDRVSRWAMDGTFLGQIGTAGLDNIRGMGLINGVVYVTNAGTANGAPGGAIVMFGTDGTPMGFFATPNANSPFGVLDHQGALLVSNSNANDDIHRYSYTGTALGTFHNSTSLNFAEQMAYAADGHVLVAGFSSNNVVKLDVNSGTVLSTFPASGARGVFQLSNGNILWTNASGAHVYNPATNSSTQIYTGGGRYLALMRLSEPIEGDVNGDGCVNDSDLLLVLFAFGNLGGPEDLDGNGFVDDSDLLIVLFNFGNGC
ncbi:MAG: hypothetical protein KIT45_00780 [Fimbriimonadia bacterium]|nr:hypothetical protein [Fimbriimonadia bacterium]